MKFRFFISLIIVLSLTMFGSPKERRFQEDIDIQRPKAEPVIIPLDINCKKGIYDITSDNNSTVHFVWWANDGYLHYANIVGNAIVNEEVVPQSADVKVNFIRPRIMVRPDGSSIHLTWMNPRPGTKLVHVWKNSAGWHREIVWTGNHISAPVGVTDMTGKTHIIGSVWASDGWHKIKYWYKDVNSTMYNRGWTLQEGPIKWRDTAMFIDKEGGIHAVYKSGRDPGKYVYCPSGGSLINSEILDIPVAQGGVCVSFGDLFVDKNMNVHHAFLTYHSETVDYSIKPAGSNTWAVPTRVSEGHLELCHKENYDNAWPSIAVDTDGIVYVAWADMPCPDTEANRITLATLENNVWHREILTLDANIDFDNKPAMTANNDGVLIVWRDWLDELWLYSIVSKEVYISNLSEGQKICASDYSNGVISIKAGVANPADITRVEFYVDGTLLGEASSEPYEYDWNIGEYNPGTHQVRVVGHKTNGDTVESEITVDIDCPPSIQLVNLFDGSTIAETMDVSVEIQDDKNAVQKVEFYVDNSLKYTDTAAPYVFRWNPASLSLGNHILTVIAYDNSSLSSTVSITVKYWPIFPPLDFTGTKRINRTLFIIEYYNHLTWSANPKNDANNITITNYRIYEVINGVKSAQPLAEVDGNTFEYNHRNLSKDEEYSYLITSVDGAGNESSGESVTVQ